MQHPHETPRRSRHTLAAAFAAALLSLTGCPPTEDTNYPPPPIPPPDTDLCDAMCDHIGPDGLGCEEGEDVYNSDIEGPKDVPNQSCGDFCRELQDKGVFVNPRCVATVPSCDVIEDYRLKEPEECGDAEAE